LILTNSAVGLILLERPTKCTVNIIVYLFVILSVLLMFVMVASIAVKYHAVKLKVLTRPHISGIVEK